MKKFFVAASSLLLLFTACSKSDGPSTPDNNTVIQGKWTGDYYVKTGFVNGTAITQKDSTLNDIIKNSVFNFKKTDANDSIVGTLNDGTTMIKGIYQLKANDSIYANLTVYYLTPATPQNIAIAGIANITSSKLLITENKKEAVEIGGEMADSTVAVYSFNKAAN
ncbi:hypothetical protein [Arachidicoccus sp.]|uniref:hypothetical protein n=1 Tax=Arachidicoccus sp. TaxID=1872624 RepID=UPI003D2385B0